MRFVLSGGGTAGHINPALALAEQLALRGHAVHFAGTPDGVEARLVPQAGIDFKAFEAAGFDRAKPSSLVRALRLVRSSAAKASAWLSDIGPDAVVCFGGYVCIPVGRAALRNRVSLVVHEQNSVMGMANRYLARRASYVALTYAEAAEGLPDASKVRLTGNPVRASVLEATRGQGRAYCGVPDDARMLLVTGGSLGARHLNAAVCSLAPQLMQRANLYVRHVTGPKEFDAVSEQLLLPEAQRQRWQLVAYEQHMGQAMAACDCVVSRAGATSLAEISALQVPALLVPFPYATADHQTTNARSYVKAGAASMVPDAQVESRQFSDALLAMVDDADARASMRQAAAAFNTRDAAAKLADVVCDAGASGPNATMAH